MMEDYKGYPASINELRAEKESDASKWTPRDTLISALREYDEGRIDTDTLVVAWLQKKSDDGMSSTAFCFRACYPNFDKLISLCERFKHWCLKKYDD